MFCMPSCKSTKSPQPSFRHALEILWSQSTMSEKKVPDIFHNDSCSVKGEPLAKRPRCVYFDEQISMILEKVCDIIISHCSSWFAVTGHLVAATLLKVVHSQILSNASQKGCRRCCSIISFS